MDEDCSMGGLPASVGSVRESVEGGCGLVRWIVSGMVTRGRVKVAGVVKGCGHTVYLPGRKEAVVGSDGCGGGLGWRLNLAVVRICRIIAATKRG